MLLPRVIPCLLVRDKGLVKTVKFSDAKYVGDPINAVRIYNEKEVDELIVLELDATRRGDGPDYKMIENLAAECRMPLCYGGGVKSVAQAKAIVGLGVEKVAVSTAAVERSALISEVAAEIGTQSTVVVIDVLRHRQSGKYEVVTRNGSTNTGIDVRLLAETSERLGAGEIVINSVDRDGTMAGYDLDLARQVRGVTNVPLTILGGAGSLEDIRQLVACLGIVGAAAGSLFVFKGKYRAVLINYPSSVDKEKLMASVPRAS